MLAFVIQVFQSTTCGILKRSYEKSPFLQVRKQQFAKPLLAVVFSHFQSKFL